MEEESEHMKSFIADLDKKYPYHIKLEDKVEMWAIYKDGWELRDTGTVKYVGPGYATVEFWKNRDFNGSIDLRLNLQSGSIDSRIRYFGYKFRGPIREVPLNVPVDESW